MGLYVVFRVHSFVHAHTKDGFGTWQHLRILKVQAHLDAKKKIEKFFEFPKDSAKLKCHTRGSNNVRNNLE